MHLPHLLPMKISQMSDEALLKRYALLKTRQRDLKDKGRTMCKAFHFDLVRLAGQKAPPLSNRARAMLGRFFAPCNEETKAVLIQLKKED